MANIIFTLIPKVIGDIEAIAKKGHNEDDGYAFRKLDDVYNALHPVLPKYGVFFAPQVLETAEERIGTGKASKLRVRIKVKYTIYADDGSFFEVIVNGEAIDSSDKGHNKALQAAFKYMLLQVFCIAVEEAGDADKSTPELKFRKEKERKSPPQKDFEIPEGKYRGKRAADIPRGELDAYIKEMDTNVKQAGRKHPKWFTELQSWRKAVA